MDSVLLALHAAALDGLSYKGLLVGREVYFHASRLGIGLADVNERIADRSARATRTLPNSGPCYTKCRMPILENIAAIAKGMSIRFKGRFQPRVVRTIPTARGR